MLLIWLACTGGDDATDDSVDPCANGGCTEPPSAPEVAISPLDPTTLDDLLCEVTVESEDPDGTAVSYTFSWTYNDQPTEITGDTVSADQTQMSQEWECTVVATDEDGESADPVTDAQVIENSPPTAPEIAITPETPTTDDLIECEVVVESTDPDDHPISYEYLWTDSAGNELDNGLQDYRFIADNTEPGMVILCNVAAFDGRAYSDTVSAQVTIAD